MTLPFRIRKVDRGRFERWPGVKLVEPRQIANIHIDHCLAQINLNLSWSISKKYLIIVLDSLFSRFLSISEFEQILEMNEPRFVPQSVLL